MINPMINLIKQHTYLVKELQHILQRFIHSNDTKSGNIKVETSRDYSQFLLLLVLLRSSAELRRQLVLNICTDICVFVEI